MRKLFLSLFLVCLAITASAIPARRVWRTYTQTDGTQLKLMLIGDEHFHYFITTDSLPVVQRDGAFYYAKASHNNMIASDILAHNIEQRPQAELSAAQDFMNQKSSIMKAASNARSTMLPALIERKPANAYQGEKKGIVILVSFSDLDYAETDPQEPSTTSATRRATTSVASVAPYTTISATTAMGSSASSLTS